MHWGSTGMNTGTELTAVRTHAGPAGRSARAALLTACYVVAGTVAYYVATQIAWALCFPDSKVSLFFPPHAVLVSILLLVPTRHWWAYVLAAGGAHFLATQQAQWPPGYALTCEAFDAVKCMATAAGIRMLDRHAAAATVADALRPGAAPEVAKHRPHVDADDRAAQRMIPGQRVADPMRQAEDPWAPRNRRPEQHREQNARTQDGAAYATIAERRGREQAVVELGTAWRH